MGLIGDTDLLAMLKELGAEAATYTPYGGEAASVYAIDDDDYALAVNGIAARPRVAILRTSDVTGTPEGGTIVFASGTWKIIKHEADGEGQSVLVLKENA